MADCDPQPSTSKAPSACKTQAEPCPKNCVCHVSQTVESLKKCIMTRTKALNNVVGKPEWTINLTAKEQAVLAIPQNCGSASVVMGMVAHELAAREQEIAQMECFKARVNSTESQDFVCQQLKPRVADVQDSLNSAIARMKACCEEANASCFEKDDASRKLVERSLERRQRMSELFDDNDPESFVKQSCIKCRVDLFDEGKLDRAALKLALRALSYVSDCRGGKKNDDRKRGGDGDDDVVDTCPSCSSLVNDTSHRLR